MAQPRPQLAEELLRRLAASLRSGQLYSKGHPIIARNLDSLARAIDALHDLSPVLVVGIVDDEFIVDEVPVLRTEALAPLVHRLRHVGIERITIDKGVGPDEIAALAEVVASTSAGDGDGETAFPTLPHIRVGRVTVAERIEGATADIASFRRLYADAVRSAEGVWDTARAEGQPDVTVVRQMVDGLAQAVSQNRSALLALTALREYDNYTFTHMVNVSILTMAQARALGIEGPLLREFGFAALMHDIGKIQTPLDILNKSGTLSDQEFAVMQRHTVDGAEILRGTPDVPTLAPVVAFEHHLRPDGSGYPEGIARPSLNLGTMLCSIADVYDAMRSNRVYQTAFPTSRVLAVLQGNDGHRFDQRLVRRFGQLIGVYPVGNLVTLTSGEIAVVVKTHAPDPYRPQIRIVCDRHGTRLARPVDVNLWEFADQGALAPEISGPAHPSVIGIDPLTLL
ncbi:MAG: HD-GYP domain-containing protein [Vicinamibacterales bacterium]